MRPFLSHSAQVTPQFSKDLADDLVLSSQQQVGDVDWIAQQSRRHAILREAVLTYALENVGHRLNPTPEKEQGRT